jgi:hypothetical protein
LKNPLRKICTAGSVRGETRSGLLYSETCRIWKTEFSVSFSAFLNGRAGVIDDGF